MRKIKKSKSKINKKSLSPLISVILLIVISVILVSVVLGFGQGFTTQGLSDSDKVIKECNQITMFSGSKVDSKGNISFKNISPGNETHTIIGYKILSTSEDSNFNNFIYFEDGDRIVTPGSTTIFQIPKFPPEDKFTIQLLTDKGEYISLDGIKNVPEELQDIPIPEPPSSENLIINFTILDTNGTIDSYLNTISLELPYGTNVTAITPTIAISEKASISPESSVVQDFTNPVIYTVTAEDSTTRIYTITVNVEEPPEEPCSLTPTNGEIYYLEHLDYIDTNVTTRAASYTLVRDLDFDDDSSYCEPETYKTSWTDSNGWTPIGASTTPFTGSFDGNNHTISNLYINRPATDYVGLFGSLGCNITSGTITNLGLEDINVIGNNTVGGLVGHLEDDAIIQRSYSTGFVLGSGNEIGGLFGFGQGAGTIAQNSYSTCSVSGNSSVGGLGGYLNSGLVTKCYSTGLVSGSTYTGGLIGDVDQGYATSSYYDSTTSGQSDNTGKGVPKTTAQMKQQATFTGWDFSTVWNISGTTYPYLRNNT